MSSSEHLESDGMFIPDDSLQRTVNRREFLRLASLISGSVAASAALVACSEGDTPSPTEALTVTEPATAAPTPVGDFTKAAPNIVARDILHVALDIPVNLDPAHASSDSEIAVLNAIYDYLVDIDAENVIQPRLATDWITSDDGLTYTVTLAENVVFHDGSPLTAADVVWTFDRLRDPASQYPTVDLYSNIESITAENDTIVVFKLKKTNPFFLYDLSDNHALIVKTETTAFGIEFNGTGPFRVEAYSPENRMELVANEKYFIPGKPRVEHLNFVFFSDPTASVDALRGGQVDLVLRMPTPLFMTIKHNPNVTPVAIPTNGFDLVRLRADRTPGNNPRVVQAFKLATNRRAIFEAVTFSLGAEGRDSPIGPLFTQYYSEETPLLPYDPVAAKALLLEAGYPDGVQLDLHVPDSGDRPDLAVMLKEQWAEAGIDVNIIVEPESVYYADNGWLEVDLGITGWGSRPVPQFYLDEMLMTDAKWNEAHFSDAEFDALALQAGTTLDETERIAAYKEIQRILIERGPFIIPYFFAQLGAIKKEFIDFRLKAFVGRTDLAAIRQNG